MLDGIIISIDVMGGDDAPDIVIDGCEHFLTHEGQSRRARFLLHGDENAIKSLLKKAPQTRDRSEIVHTDSAIEMDAKPSQALRRGKGTSMWNAIASVKSGEARVGISAGNTGALMAMSKLQLRMKAGVQRPAIAGIWPRNGSQCIVLDIGANIDCDETQLTEFAVLGEAYFRALYGKTEPSVGLLNVGTEDLKGNAVVKAAHERFQAMDFGLNYQGYVEGNDISVGTIDVIVTDGFTGNIALKTAEGTGRLVGGFVKDALDGNILGKLAKIINARAFSALKAKIDPRNFNGGAFLGLNGIVVKSHGGTDKIGFANALNVAMRLAESNFNTEIENTLARLHDAELEIETAAEV